MNLDLKNKTALVTAASGGIGQKIALVADNGTAEGCAVTIAELPDVEILVNNLGTL